MRIVLQRVSQSKVRVENKVVGEIADGLLLFVGITHDDTETDADFLVKKVSQLRIFADEDGKMNNSVQDIGGQILVVSQFTLYANCKKGNRPSFVDAARPEEAEKLYEYFVAKLRELGIDVETGVFGAHMEVEITNDGPVTLILDTKK